MINLSFTVDNIATVILIYDRIRVARSTAEAGPFDEFATLDPSEITLAGGQSVYTAVDTAGAATHWYRSQYYNTTNSGVVSGWSDPVLGEPGDLYYNPLFPPEVAYGTSDQLIIDRIRRLIGDPLGLRREYGEEAASSIHTDNKTYELDEKGWPVSVTMGGTPMNDTTDPSINGYKYLRFDEDISITTISGCIEYGVDVWYYTFRFSDREIMDAYDNCPTPPGLTSDTVNSEAYMLQTAMELLMWENWENSTEDGALVRDEGSTYDPSPGFRFRENLLKRLQKRLDDLIKSLRMFHGGVLID